MGEEKEFTNKEWDRIELYMKAGASQKRIAESFGICTATLKNKVFKRYGENYEAVCRGFNTMGELLIEATQFQKALGGNIQLLIWLGKIRCGQREPEIISTIPPAQENIDKDHIIMQLKHKIRQLESKNQDLEAANIPEESMKESMDCISECNEQLNPTQNVADNGNEC
jgi:hypothetical protein